MIVHNVCNSCDVFSLLDCSRTWRPGQKNIMKWNITLYYSFFLFGCSCARGLGSDGLCGSGRSNPGAQGGFGHLQPAARKPTRLLVADSWAKEINRIDTDREDSSARKKTIALCPIHYQVVHKTGMILFPLLERIAVLLEVNIMEILSLIRVPVFPSSSPLVDQTNWGREDSTTSEMRI